MTETKNIVKNFNIISYNYKFVHWKEKLLKQDGSKLNSS